MSEPKADPWEHWEKARFDEFALGALAVDDAADPRGAMIMRHFSFEKDEDGLICWDLAGSCLVRVEDYAKQEYWGERVLRVREIANYPFRLSWDREQSDLCELGAPWQGETSLMELRRRTAEQLRELSQRIGLRFEAAALAKHLAAESGAPKASRGVPRL